MQHAHQKGIIHRDLKPGNVLITKIDGQARSPKVIDFGVAKATDGEADRLSLSPTSARSWARWSTCRPEQADSVGDDIDTRADIYSLGVILYELLTGLPPIDASSLKRAAIPEMIRIIREEDPPKPSTSSTRPPPFRHRRDPQQTDPRKLMTMLHGELDWVVMKCPGEAPRTPLRDGECAWLAISSAIWPMKSVEARPPSRGYRFQKFVKRHKGQVIAASLVLLALARRDRRHESRTGFRPTGPRCRSEQAAIAVTQRDKAVTAERQHRATSQLGRGRHRARQGHRLRSQDPGAQEQGDQRLPHPGPADPGRASEQRG